MKNNITYYRHESGSHNHWKFKTLRRKYGWAGEGKFWALNNMIADAEYCILDLSEGTKIAAVAADLDFDVPELMEFIEFLAKSCLLITELEGGITTGIIQETYKEVDEKREYQRKWKREKSNSKNPDSNIEIPVPIIEKEQSKVKESKVKENRISGGGGAAPPPAKKQGEKKASDIEARKLAFAEKLKPFVEKYGRSMVKEFYAYWTEPNKSGSKFRMEMEKTWDLTRRMNTWASNDKSFNQLRNQTPIVTNGKSIEDIREEQGRQILDAVN